MIDLDTNKGKLAYDKLELIEKSIISKDLSRAIQYVEELVVSLQKITFKGEIASEVTTRLTSSIINILLNAGQLTALEEIRLTNIHWLIIDIAEASGFNGFSKYAKLIGQVAAGDNFQLSNASEIFRSNIFLDFDTLPESILDWIISKPYSPLKAIMYIMHVGQRLVITEKGENNRAKMLSNFDVIDALPMHGSLLDLVARAYMRCSYSSIRNKNLPKIKLNNWVENLISSQFKWVKNNDAISSINRKPICIVPLEAFTSSHAMYRVYKNIISELSDKYTLISISFDADIDEKAKLIFDKSYIIDNQTWSKQIDDLIKKYNPQLVFFPSLGMRHWTIVLSNFRWANTQICSVGHPADPFANNIDKILTSNTFITEQRVCSHIKYIKFQKDKFLTFSNHEHYYGKFKKPKEMWSIFDKSKSGIAVNGKSYKLSYDLMDMMNALSLQAMNSNISPFEISIFPNENGHIFEGVRKKINRLFPDFIVYESKSYDEYLIELSKHRVSVSPFNFTNTNGVIDCLLTGVIPVALRGVDESQLAEVLILGALGLDELLCFHEKSELQKFVYKIISDNNFYKLIQAQIADKIGISQIDHSFDSGERLLNLSDF